MVPHVAPMDSILRRPKRLALTLIFLGAHIGTSTLVLNFFAERHVVAMFWPASGLALAAVLLGGNRFAAAVLVGAVFANWIAGNHLDTAILLGFCNFLEALIGAWLLKRVSPIDTGLNRARDHFRLFLFGGVLAPITSAAAGATIIVAQSLSLDSWLHNFQYWWMGNSLGILVFTPLILIWRHIPRLYWGNAQRVEAVVGSALAIFFGQVIFVGSFLETSGTRGLSFVMFVFIFWAAVRFGRRATSLILLMILAQIISGKIMGHVFFTETNAELELIVIWFYIAVMFVVGMALATFVNEREAALKAFTETAARLERISIQAAIGSWEFDLRTNLMHLSAEARRIIKRDNPEPLALDAAFEYLQPEYREAQRARFERAQNEGTPWDVEFGMVTHNGEQIWVRTTGYAVDEDDRRSKLIGTIHDLTNIKRSDQARRQTEIDFRRLVETAEEGIWIIDETGLTQFVNLRMGQMLGYSPEEIIGKTFLSFIQPDLKTEALHLLGRRQNEIREVHEFVFTHKDGRLVWTLCSTNPITNGLGEVTGALAMVTDITSRKKIELALYESELRFRILIESSNEAIFVHHAGFLVYANPACARLMGADDQAQMVGMNALDIPAKPFREMVIERIKQINGGSKNVDFMEMQFSRFDGTLVDVEVSGSRITYDGKQSALVVARDITKRKHAELSLQQNEMRLRQVFQTLSEAVVLNELVYDEHGEVNDHKVVMVNDAYYRVADYNKNMPVIGTLGSKLYDIDPDQWKTYLRSLKASTQTTRTEMFSHISNRYFEIFTSPVSNEQFVTTFHDITERKSSEIALRDSENKIRSLLAAMTDVILVLDQDGRYIEIAATNSDLLYRPRNELIGMTIRDVFPPSQADYFLHHIKSTLTTNGTPEIHYQLEINNQHVWFAAKISKLTDRSVVVVARDVTESKLAEEKILYLGQHDMLTGLPNRTLFEDRLEQTMAVASAHETPFALLFLDIDHFKRINDTYGHLIADSLLKEVATRLIACVKPIDTVSRRGGDEFIILLRELTHPEDAAIIAQSICQKIALPIFIGSSNIRASISIGVAVYPRDGKTPEQLLKNADLAMYHAKQTGRNQFQFFSEELNRITHERLEIESALRQAIELGQLEVFYQPQLDLNTGKISSCEALLRWHHPAWGDVSPSRFIPIAEESDLILEVGTWVLNEVAKQFSQFRSDGINDLRISVNVSAVQLQNSNFPVMVEAALATHDMRPEDLEFEVTETMLMEDTANAVAAIARLSSFGIKFSIDDFGTGYSSLSYLRQLKIQYLKIDQSFVRDLMIDSDDAVIVRSIIGLAHNLRLQVIAEGVETAEQLDHLRNEGCDIVQGYLLARPMPYGALIDFLRSR